MFVLFTAVRLTAMAAVASVVTAAVAAPAHAVTGGAPADLGYLVKLTSASSACSGVLVHPQWVLTTRACVSLTSDGPGGRPGTPVRATVGRPDLTTMAGHELDVTWLVSRPERGAVLARLARPVPGIALPRIAAQAPVAGQDLTVYGFGRTATEWVPDRAHAGAMTVTSVTATSLAIGQPQSGAVTTCRGDAGGPAVNAAGELVAIHDGSWQGGCRGTPASETRRGASGIRVDDLAAWITAETRRQPVQDFDGDRLGDLVYYWGNADKLTTALSVSTPGTPAFDGGRVLDTGWATVRDQKLADLDGDRRPDVVGRVSNDLAVWLNTSRPGRPDYVRQQFVLTADFGAYTSFALTDFDADDRVDVLAYRTRNGQPGDELVVYLNTGTAGKPSIGPGQALQTGWTTVTNQALADVDGDGLTDILGRVGTELAVWRNTSTPGKPSYIAQRTTLTKGFGAVSRYWADDADDDGRVDILGLSRDGDVLSSWRNTGAPGGPRLDGGTTVSSGWRTVNSQQILDVDGDGRADIVGRVGDRITVWLHRGAAGSVSYSPPNYLTSDWTGVNRFAQDGARF